MGLNENQSIIAVTPGTAIDMDNFEVDLSGAVAMRDGYTLEYDFGAPIHYLGNYYTTDGTVVWIAVAGTSFYEASAQSGPWTDRTGGVTLSSVDGPWIGSELNGKFVLVNGTDAPVYHEQGKDLVTLKTASLIQPVEGLSLGWRGANDLVKNWQYVVTAVTANGETPASNLVSVNGNTDFTGFAIDLSWNLRAGAQGYNVYRQDGGFPHGFQKIASIGRLTNTFTDTGSGVIAGGPRMTNTATNTPYSWDQYPPQTIATIARGRSQRMMATRDSTVFASSLSDILDWETPSDSFQLPIRGGTDNTIRCISALYDYTIFFSDTNAFIYTGSSYSDFTQTKILNIGCRSPNSLQSAGDELYFWSDLGPNSLSRVQYGQDLETNEPFHLPVQKTVHHVSNKSAWSKIVAWKDVRNLRIGWAYPVGASTSNSKALIRGTVKNGWSRHSMPAIVSSAVDEDRNVFVGCEDGKVYRLYSGNTDNGVPIVGYYTTGWYDSQSQLNRYMDNLSVIMDKSIGAYSLTVELFWDFATTASSTHVLTETTTDGINVVDASSTANTHFLYTRGIGRYFQLRFSATESPTHPRILGWREEMYAKGRR